jgi:activator-of-BECN1-regulated-autophagy protein 1
MDLKTVSVLLDEDDEVNIAQFHPIPGNGIVYGTKRGKVKAFRRNKYQEKVDAILG